MERKAIVFKTWSTILIALLLMSASVNSQPNINYQTNMYSSDPLKFSFWNWYTGRFMIVSDYRLYSMDLGGGYYEANLNQTYPTAAGFATNSYEVFILSEGQLDTYFDYGSSLSWNSHYPSSIYNGARSLLLHSAGQYLLIGRTDGTLVKIDRSDLYTEVFSFNNYWGIPRTIREFLPNQYAYVLFEWQSMVSIWDVAYSYIQYTWGQYNNGYALRHLLPDRNDSQLVYVGYEGFNELHRLKLDPTTGSLMIKAATPSFSCTPDNLEMLDQFDLLFSQECGSYMLIRGYDMNVVATYHHGNSAVYGGASTTSYFDGGSYIYTLIPDYSNYAYVFSVNLSYDPNGYCVQNQNTYYCSLCNTGSYLNDYYYPYECLSSPSQGFGVDIPRGASNPPYQYLAPCSQEGCQDCSSDYTQCQSCLPYFYADYHVTPVVCHASPNTFPPQFGMNGYTLDPCLDSNCLSCRWSNYAYCEECPPGYAVNWNTDSMCYQVPTGIPDGYGIEPGSNPFYLNPCNVSDCLRCRLDRYVCDECQPGFGLRTSENFCYNVGNMPLSLGFDLTTNPLLVEPCLLSSTCEVCATNRLICTQCIPTYFLQDAPNNCHLEAGIPAAWGIIVASTPPKIASCVANCLLCTLNHTVCTSCSPPFNVISGGCVQCSSTEFFNGTICQPCDPSCATCNGSTANSCLSCPVGFQLSTNTCVAITCNQGQYLSASTCLPCDATCLTCSVAATTCLTCTSGRYFVASTCPVCDPSCSTCNGSTANSCLSCPVGFQLSTNTCVAITCNPGQYLTASTCLPCDATCLTCSVAATTCLTCAPGRYFLASSCPVCHPSCATCNSSTANSCLSCPVGFQLASGACVTVTCNPGQYLNLSSCLACDPLCLTCQSTATNCLSCPPGTYLQGSSCLPCDASCPTCSGSSASACLSCNPGKQLSAGTCIDSYCPPNKYMNSGNCTNCHSSCLTCNGGLSTNCTSCQTGMAVTAGACLPIVCPAAKYLSGNDCLNCHTYCATCSGPSSLSCLSCPSGYTLKPNGFCEFNCLSSEYNDNTVNVCFPCDVQCVTCTKAGRYGCSSCPPGSSLRFDGLCFKTCPPGFYYKEADNNCYPCNISCLSCMDASQFDCLECKNGLYVLPDKTCNSPCPSGTVLTNNTRCFPCHATCTSCSNTSDTGCTECIPGFFKLPNMKCDSTIPPHHYIAPGNIVKACDSSCGTCDGDGPNRCLTCRTPETHTLSQEKECVNCMERYLTDKATCSFVVRLRFEQSSVKAVNPRASASVKLTFDKESDHATTLSLARFQAAIKLQVKELADTEYTLQFVRREGEYTVDIFSLKPPTTPVTLEASVLINHVLFSSATGFPSLVFAPVPATRPIELKKGSSERCYYGLIGRNWNPK